MEPIFSLAEPLILHCHFCFVFAFYYFILLPLFGYVQYFKLTLYFPCHLNGRSLILFLRIHRFPVTGTVHINIAHSISNNFYLKSHQLSLLIIESIIDQPSNLSNKFGRQ